jgi:hypothetical protein
MRREANMMEACSGWINLQKIWLVLERRVFIIANGVDIQSPILHDILSDKPQDHMKKHSPTATEESLTSLQDNSATSTPKDSEWYMW